jgi:hypothetical protein
VTVSGPWPALAGTIAVEASVVAALAARYRLGTLRIVGLSIVLNLITQPLLSAWLRFALVGQDHLYLQHLAFGEFVVWLLEAAAYAALLKDLPRWIALGLGLSGAANAASLLIGLALPL